MITFKHYVTRFHSTYPQCATKNIILQLGVVMSDILQAPVATDPPTATSNSAMDTNHN